MPPVFKMAVARCGSAARSPPKRYCSVSSSFASCVYWRSAMSRIIFRLIMLLSNRIFSFWNCASTAWRRVATASGTVPRCRSYSWNCSLMMCWLLSSCGCSVSRRCSVVPSSVRMRSMRSSDSEVKSANCNSCKRPSSANNSCSLLVKKICVLTSASSI